MLRSIYRRLASIEEGPRKASHLECMNTLPVRFYHQLHACTIHYSVTIELSLVDVFNLGSYCPQLSIL